jgi:hypothetical protein
VRYISLKIFIIFHFYFIILSPILIAAHFILKKQVDFDVIFIDGSHEYETVLMDITLHYSEKRRCNGFG